MNLELLQKGRLKNTQTNEEVIPDMFTELFVFDVFC